MIVWTFPSLIYQPPLIVNEACYGPAAIKDETAKQRAKEPQRLDKIQTLLEAESRTQMIDLNLVSNK